MVELLVLLLLAQQNPPAADQSKRTDLNLLGSADAAAGESRRNENVQFNLIDNNALKYLNIRLGTNATIVTEFKPERKYFGSEYGGSPPGPPHLAPAKPADGLHGSASYGRSDSLFTARSFFQAGNVQPAHENLYGVSAGAGVWRGAHLSVEGSQQTVRGSVNGNVLVPLQSERSPLTTDPALRSLVQRWIDAYPKLLPNRTDIDPRALNTNAPQSIDTSASTERLDQRLSPHDRLFAQHAFTNQKVLAFQFVAGQNPDTNTKSHTARATWEHRWDDRSFLDLTFGLDRTHSLLTPEPNAVGPQVVVGTSYQSLGPGATIPIDRRLTRFRQAALLRKTVGNHQLSFGAELDRLRNNGLEASSERGNYYFRSDFGRDAITNFRLGIASRYSAAVGNGYRGFRWFEQQIFAGDVWKARKDFALSYGVRYTPQTAPTEVHNLAPIDFHCDCATLGPQLGLAWKTPGLGVIRAAYGLHFGEIYPQTLQQTRWDPPNFLKVEVQAPASILAPLAGMDLGPGARHLHFDVPPNLKTPYSHQYTFAWEPWQGHRWSATFAYIGSRSHRLFMMWFANRAIVVPGVPLTTATIQERRPDPRYFELREARNASNAYFDAARATFKAPSWRGLTAEVSYWLSKAIDTGSAYTNMAAGDEALQGYAQSERPVAEDLKGPSVFDQSHAFMARFSWADRHGWRVSGTFLAKTGLPFTVLTGSDAPGFGNVDGSNGDRPNLLDPAVLGRTLGNPDTSVALLPRSAFGYIAPGESRGNLGENTFRRGGIRNLNASVSKTFGHATVRAESVNLLNTPQFAAPNADLSSPAFGKITNTLNDGRTFVFGVAMAF